MYKCHFMYNKRLFKDKCRYYLYTYVLCPLILLFNPVFHQRQYELAIALMQLICSQTNTDNILNMSMYVFFK